MSPPRVSVIIRTRNEEAWIGECLAMVFRQDHPDFEVILVDNRSTDHTLEVARRHPVRDVVSVERYRPGQALNAGIRRASGALIACLSAHCIPRDEGWLRALAAGFDDAGVAGVYGRQLPLAFSTALDKRDLLTVFGLDRRVQVKDYFFHNANSMIRRSVWERIPFDEEVTNIEDRHWGKAVIEAGYRLVYEPRAAVYHHHGINQNGDSARAAGVSDNLETLEREVINDLPEVMRPENCNVAAVAPVLGEPRQLMGGDLLTHLLQQVGGARYVRSVYAFSESEAVRERAERAGARAIRRPPELMARERTLGEVLAYCLGEIERGGDFPQIILYANYLCPFRPARLFDELITELQYKGLDSVFPAYVDYNDHWVNSGAGTFERVSESLRPAPDRPRLFRSLYGLGCASRASVIRRTSLIGGKVGIIPLGEHIYTLRCTDERPEPLPPSAEEPSLIGWTAQMFLREFRP
ncbi:MAG: glycosyltransferase family 2 protein [Proteobacteria bacterium]|nr:glycosyltransferase family 2 protein [Pseudomonadota bacterium]